MKRTDLEKVLNNGLSRRDFIKMVGLGGASLMLAGCGSSDATSSASSTTSASSASASTSDESVIRFGCEASYVPYEWKQSDQTEYTLPIENLSGMYADGYDIQLMRKIADHMGKTPVVVNIAFNGLIAALQNGQIDAICAGMSATDERKQSVDFSDPYLTSGVGIMVARSSKYASATSIADFAGASMLSEKNSLPDEVIDQIEGVNHLTPTDDIPSSINRVVQGTCDAVTCDANNKEIYEKKYPDFVVLVFTGSAGFSTPGVDPAVAVKKGDSDFLTSINEVIDALSESDRQQLWNKCSDRAPE